MTTQLSPEPAIREPGLDTSYQQLEVLRGVDLEVAPGSIFALLGPNGAGKTTIVRILATLLKADTGTASVNGLAVATHPNQRLALAEHERHHRDDEGRDTRIVREDLRTALTAGSTSATRSSPRIMQVPLESAKRGKLPVSAPRR
jgi:ABC-type branched-subunit amino acid transport system ATPase component